jgi:hypothetical protein
MIKAKSAPVTVEQQVVHDLASQIAGSKAFKSKRATKADPTGLLRMLAEHFPASPGDPINRLGATSITRFNKRLRECMLKDRSLWWDQKLLRIERIGGNDRSWALKAVPLVGELNSAPLRFWFHQCAQPQHDKKIVIAEPLFFFSNELRAYIRLLDLNHEGPFEHGDVDRLTEDVRKHLSGFFPISHLKKLDLTPVRHYIPAGDSYGASAIQRWFKATTEERIEITHEIPSHEAKANLIVLASRSTNPLLARFQEENPNVRLRLTETGISFDGQPYDDNISRGNGVARVVVTSWASKNDNALTFIASNHTRAIEAVADLLVSEESLRPILDTVFANLEDIPMRFQLAFDVPIQVQGMKGSDPLLFQPLRSLPPIVY